MDHRLQSFDKGGIVAAVMANFVNNGIRKHLFKRKVFAGGFPFYIFPRGPVAGLCVTYEQKKLTLLNKLECEYETCVVCEPVHVQCEVARFFKPVIINCSPFFVSV